MLGMSLETFTLVHVLVGLAGILAGVMVMAGLIAGRPLNGWNTGFLVTTGLAALSGFGFPFERVLPSHIFSVLTLAALAGGVFALYSHRLQGAWRWIYITCAAFALYLNVFIAVVQSFQKIPVLQAMAPTQSELPFVVAQVAALAACVTMGRLAAVKTRQTQLRTA